MAKHRLSIPSEVYMATIKLMALQGCGQSPFLAAPVPGHAAIPAAICGVPIYALVSPTGAFLI
jgi:hypothetical protein